VRIFCFNPVVFFRRCPSLCPWRSLATALVLLTLAGAAGGQFRAYLDEPTHMAELLGEVDALLARGRHERAVLMLIDALEIGPDAVQFESRQGVLLSVRETILTLPPEARQLYEARLGEQANDTLAVARHLGTIAAHSYVVNRYPGTAASREAAQTLWAMAFEQGDFPRTIEAVEVFLADPLVTGDVGRRALVVMAIAARKIARDDVVRKALTRLKKLPAGSPIDLYGQRVRPVSYVSRMLKDGKRGQGLIRPGTWPQVGGAFDRGASGGRGLDVSAAMAFIPRDRRGVVLPDRKALLERRARRFYPMCESALLATERSVVATIGPQLIVFDRQTGQERWRRPMRPMPLPLTWPSCGGGVIAATVIDEDQAKGKGSPWDVMRRASRRLVVWDELSGQVLWAWPAAERDVPSGPAKPLPEAAAGGGVLLRIIAAHGSVDGLEPVGSPLVYGGRVFIGAVRAQRRGILVDCYLACFDLTTGQPLWNRFVGSGPIGRLGSANLTLDRMVPTTDTQRVYVESAVQTLAAVDLATGAMAWSRSFERPRPTRSQFIAATHWPESVTDAPSVFSGRVAVSDVFGPKQRILDAATGELVWESKKTVPGWRIGVVAGTVYWTHGTTLQGSDREGKLVFEAALPGEVTGRGFVAEDAVYVPTAVGIVRVALAEGKASVVNSAEYATSAQALVPVGKTILCVRGDEVRLLGSQASLVAAARTSVAARRNSPSCHLRLGQLYRQGREFAAADRHLREALKLVKRPGQGEGHVELRRRVAADMVALARQWAADLRRDGKADEAQRKLQHALSLVTEPEDRLAATLALADHHAAVGDIEQSAKLYRSVLADDLARVRLVNIDTLGLERSLATDAALSLARIHSDRAALDASALRRVDPARSGLLPLASLSWNAPSYMVCGGDAFAPLVWVRPDGLAALGPRGDVRWITRGSSEPDNRLPRVVVNKTFCVVASDSRVVAHNRRSGDVLWRWQPEKGQTLAGLPVGGGRDRQMAMARHFGPAGILLRPASSHDSGERVGGVAVTERSVIVTVSPKGQMAQWVSRLDIETGRATWATEIPRDTAFRDLAVKGGRVLVLHHATNGRLVLQGLDELSGSRLWQFEATVPAARALYWLADGGLVVLNDSTAQCTVLRIADGQVLWQGRPDGRWLPGARPMAVRNGTILFDSAYGYAALDSLTGRILWRAVVSDHADRPKSSAVCGGVLVATGGDNHVSGFNLADGRRLWRRPIDGAGDRGCTVTAWRNQAIVWDRRSKGGKARFIEPGSGKRRAAVALKGSGGAAEILAGPSTVYVVQGDTLTALVPADELPPEKAAPAEVKKGGEGK
jgi:outer membrane protein assembly factor BamB